MFHLVQGLAIANESALERQIFTLEGIQLESERRHFEEKLAAGEDNRVSVTQGLWWAFST